VTGTPSVDDLLAAAVGAVPGGSTRPGQQAMAHAVAKATESSEHLLVQAGTGTGKSLAYLAPALLVDGPVVVSTATLALQSQLVDHDLPRLADAVEPVLRRRPTFAVLKGRHHYACLARIENLSEDEPADTLFDDAGPAPTKWLGEAGRLGKQIQRLRDWALESETGDRDELDPGVDDSAWRLVSMPASVSARPAARTARSASPRRRGRGPARPTWSSPTTACSPSTCFPGGTSSRRTGCSWWTRHTSWPTACPARRRPS
jgi:ATP-dependent DNA helicase DinG